jgi:tetratricopeptide (TPR) repeat protein
MGSALLALALALLLAGDGGGRSDSPAAAPADPFAATNEEIAFWEARVAADPADFVAYNRLASAYIQRGRETGDVADYSRAKAAVDASLSSLPGDNAGAYALLATLQNVRHEFAAAAETARHTLVVDPSQEFVYATLGDAQLGLGLYDEAFESYLTLAEEAPGLAAFSRLAHVYELRGDLANAQTAWENALSTDGGRNAEATAWANTQFGTFYFNQGDLDDAAAHYDAALDAFPGYIHALAGQARVATAGGDYDTAVGLYSQVAERQPLPEYIAALGDVFVVSGRAAEAAEQYALVEVIGRLYAANGINTDLQMAVFLADHDLRPGEAVAAALALYQQTPDSIYAADALAWTLYKDGRADEALPYVEQALRLGTPDAGLWYHAGLVLAATADEAGARQHLERALDINPHFTPLQASIARETLEGLGG